MGWGGASPWRGGWKPYGWERSQWYRWADQTTARNALDYVNFYGSWYPSVVTCKDGLYGFPKVYQGWFEARGHAEEQQISFENVFSPRIDTFNFEWL